MDGWMYGWIDRVVWLNGCKYNDPVVSWCLVWPDYVTAKMFREVQDH